MILIFFRTNWIFNRFTIKSGTTCSNLDLSSAQRFSTPYYSASSSGMSIVLSEEEFILSATSPSISARLGCCLNPPRNFPRSGPEGRPPLASAAHAGGGEAGAALGRGVRHALHPRHDGPRCPSHHLHAYRHQTLLAAQCHHRSVSTQFQFIH